MTPAEYWAEQKKKKKAKYDQKTSITSDGHAFASNFERRTYEFLKLLVAAGELRDLETQCSVYLTTERVHFIPDFSAWDVGLGEKVWLEAKGFETPVYRIKRRLWKGYGPGRLRVYKPHPNEGLYLHEEIIPRGQETPSCETCGAGKQD